MKCESKIILNKYKYKIQGFRIKGKLMGHNQYTGKIRSSRYIGNAEKKATEKTISYFIQDAKLKPVVNKCDILIVFYEGDKRRDPDNISSSKKFIFDALVDSGILQKDGQKFVGNLINIIKTSPIKGEWYVDVYLLERLEEISEKEICLLE